MTAITTLGLDADDTLWHNERTFRLSQERFSALLADHAEAGDLARRLDAAERRNLGHYGFGVKAFVLSMIETALEVTNNRVPGEVIAELIATGQEMLADPIELLPGVADTIDRLAGSHRLVLVTKGDLLDQERKLAQSGLGDHFSAVEIVSDKTPAVYGRIFGDGGWAMAGNSLRSDVLPALEAGGLGIHVPHDTTWSYEVAEEPQDHPRFHRAEVFTDLPQILAHHG